jgi:ATP-dependent Clp protease ATP-binding subunit ClpB
VIQKRLIDRLALAMLEREFSEGDVVEVDVADGDLTFEKQASKREGEPVAAGSAA